MPITLYAHLIGIEHAKKYGGLLKSHGTTQQDMKIAEETGGLLFFYMNPRMEFVLTTDDELLTLNELIKDIIRR